MLRVGGNAHGLVAAVEDLVREPPVLTSEHERDVSVGTPGHELFGSGVRLTPHLPAGPASRGHGHHPDHVRDGIVELLELLHGIDDFVRIVGNPGHPVRVEDGGRD